MAILMTNQQAFSLVAAIIFGVVALFHLLRLIFGWHVRVGPRDIPMWISIAGLIVAAGLALWGFWLLL
jgi:hypothetical protein